eukprot:403374572
MTSYNSKTISALTLIILGLIQLVMSSGDAQNYNYATYANYNYQQDYGSIQDYKYALDYHFCVPQTNYNQFSSYKYAPSQATKNYVKTDNKLDNNNNYAQTYNNYNNPAQSSYSYNDYAYSVDYKTNDYSNNNYNSQGGKQSNYNNYNSNYQQDSGLQNYYNYHNTNYKQQQDYSDYYKKGPSYYSSGEQKYDYNTYQNYKVSGQNLKENSGVDYLLKIIVICSLASAAFTYYKKQNKTTKK